MTLTCPHCQSKSYIYIEKHNLYVCKNCEKEFTQGNRKEKLRIFLSYGHDKNEELVRLIKADLEARGHDVWFDKSEIKGGKDWRRSITDGILQSDKVVSILSKHSVRDPGVCRDEIAIAIGAKGGNIQTILVEGEEEVTPPSSISHIQWLDMHNWLAEKTKGEDSWKKWYESKFSEIVEVIESEESRHFAGEIEKLKSYLKPISSDARIAKLLKKGFVGREWIFEKIEEWRISENRESRIFWLMGNPGVGKSAIAANLSHFGKDKVIAAQFVEYDKADHRNPARVIRSLAFQLATRLPDYRKLLLTLPEIKNLDEKSAPELFEYLLAQPLNHGIDGGMERYLIIIDALDEAKEEEQNPLVEMLARHAFLLPEWIGLVVTSRNEKNVTDPLQGLKPFILDTETEANRNDIATYIEVELEEQLEAHSDQQAIIDQLLEKSEGVFLYAEWVCSDIQSGNLSLDNLDAFPVGLSGIYQQFFLRQFPDASSYRRDYRPVLRVILTALEPLPINLLIKLMDWNREELNDFTRALGSLFPIIGENEQRVIKPYHKSVIDWITQEATSGSYFVSLEKGRQSLIDFGWKQYLTGADKLDLYFIKWLPRHLTEMEKWDEVTDLLCDLDFIQQKAVNKLTYELVDDLNIALNALPEYQPEKEKERKRQERLDKYTQDLIACAEGKISRFDLEVPESITYRTDEEIEVEIERIKTKPTRADKIKDFLIFLGQEAGNLENGAGGNSYYIHQKAWNYANEGPVSSVAEKFNLDNNKFILRRSNFNRPLWNPLPRVLKTLIGHYGEVNSVAITPYGDKAVSSSNKKNCILWDLDSGRPLKTSALHVFCVAITPDGKRAVYGSGIDCILWDLDSGKQLKTLSGHIDRGLVTSIAVTPNGKRAVSSSDFEETFILWDLDSGNLLKKFSGHCLAVTSMAITPDGKKAISASGDCTLWLWNLESGKLLKTLLGHSKYVNSVTITPDGKKAVSASDDKTCIVWNLDSGKPLKTLSIHSGSVKSIAITPDGKKAISASSDKTCILWDLDTGKPLKTFLGHSDIILSVGITPDGKKAISASRDKTCILWDLDSPKPMEWFSGHSGSIEALAITPDGSKTISASVDNTCIVWDMNSGKPLKTLTGHTKDVKTLTITPDGRRAISTSYDHTSILWDLNSGKPLKAFTMKTPGGHSRTVDTVVITPDEKMAVSVNSSEGQGAIWNLDSGNILGSFLKTFLFTIMPDGKKAISVRHKSFTIWDLNSGKILKTLSGTVGHKFLAITPDGKGAISTIWDNTLLRDTWRLWNLNSGKSLKTLPSHNVETKSLIITPDGRKAVFASHNLCAIWELASDKPLKWLKGHSDNIESFAIMPDGKKVVSASRDKICIVWDLDTGDRLAHFYSSDPLTVVALSSKRIVLGSTSGEVIFLNASKDLLMTGTPTCTIRKIWDSESKCHQFPSADCLSCGHRFPPPKEVLRTIEHITKKYALKPEQSPCLELPEEAWEEPGLIGHCPKCREKLKFNPFIAGGD